MMSGENDLLIIFFIIYYYDEFEVARKQFCLAF